MNVSWERGGLFLEPETREEYNGLYILTQVIIPNLKVTDRSGIREMSKSIQELDAKEDAELLGFKGP